MPRETAQGGQVAREAAQLPADRQIDFRTISWRSSVGEWVIQDGCISYANPMLASLLGRELCSILGESPLEFIHPEDRQGFTEQLNQRLSGQAETSPFEIRLLRPDGGIVFAEVLESRLEGEGPPARMGTIIDVTRRKLAEMAMEERLAFERLLTELSASFVNLSVEQIDAQILVSLKRLVEFLGNDRSTLLEFGNDTEHVLVTHSYSVAGCEAFPLGEFPIQRLPWFIGQIHRGEFVFVRDISQDLPSEANCELEYCREHRIQSNVSVPLAGGGEILGGLTFAFLSRRCEWPSNIISRLNLVGELFANALLRKRTEGRLRSALAENEQLRRRLEQENEYLREQASLKHQHGRIVSGGDAMARVLARAERVAITDSPVLLLGETGTGKELLAQTIHELSSRKCRPMVIVNCASLPATLIESELFGRAAGAYTGAASSQVGRFELADKSSLFLDEIGELPLELQAKLLRVLQDGRFERLGSPKTLTADVRVIAATNRNLEQAMRDGRFRADLYHRLNVFPIQLPPLRERREDIPPLVWFFVEQLGRRMGKSIKRIPRKTMQRLQEYHWPGNVRELSNIIERAMILTSDDSLAVEVPSTDEAIALTKSLKECEREQILCVLQQTGWRIRGVGGAAERLDIKPTTLEAKMAKLGLRRPGRP